MTQKSLRKTKPISSPNYHELLEFWFSDVARPYWLVPCKEFDQQVKDRFYSLYEQAYMGNLTYWQDFPEGSLALVLIFDQLGRCIFRDLPQSLATDHKAMGFAKQAIRRQMDKKLISNEQKQFLYLPFIHSENLADIKVGMGLFASTPGDLDVYANTQLSIIETFGRFPERNKLLKRYSTKEEMQFLKAQKTT